MIPENILDNPDFKKVARGFNEWMRTYIDEPEKFQHEISTMLDFIGADIHGMEPDYGTEQALTLLRYIEKTTITESDDAAS